MKIDRVEIENFKSLKSIKLNLGNLTLITGVNSSGKSSFIQTLLLLKQNESISNIDSLKLKGEYIKIDDLENILYQEYIPKNTYKEEIDNKVKVEIKEVDIKIKLISNEISSELNFVRTKKTFSKDDEVYEVTINYTPFIDNIPNQMNLFASNFQFLDTNRIAPQTMYEMSTEHLKNGLLGLQGEYTAHYLNVHKNNKINISALKHHKAMTNRFIENISLWLSEISDGIEISTNIYPELGLVSLLYSYNYGAKRTNSYTPLNVGFGITFILPIIVAILKAKKGDLLIIENPESHLHPKGQSKIAELCAIASANGVQIIVETHSDHFLNGIMIATKNKILKPKESKIYFFKKEKDELNTKIDELNINSEGKIDKWSKDFFDQYENDMMELL